jgi:hypothetical protein
VEFGCNAFMLEKIQHLKSGAEEEPNFGGEMNSGVFTD